ncbi:MAG: IniB N-terminal domain-containing protein [Actinomycetota bacterium]|nr:IniB N-terminal domain-containing protein [Actinomycetota bacterium]
MANDTQSLLQWLLDLLNDPASRADFAANPDKFLIDHGHGDLTSGDLHDALCLAADNGNSHNDNSEHHYNPPHHYNKGEDAGHYLKEYITNNYTNIEDRSTNIDDSVHQRVDTHGGDFSERIDNHPTVASGDGSTAVGHDANGNISSAGHDNTTAFGKGDATHASFDDAKFGSGSGVSLKGDASGHADDNSTDTAVHGGDGPTSVNAVGAHGDATQSADQSHTDNSFDQHIDDHTKTDSHDETNSDNTVHTHDGDNVELHA